MERKRECGEDTYLRWVLGKGKRGIYSHREMQIVKLRCRASRRVRDFEERLKEGEMYWHICLREMKENGLNNRRLSR